MPEMLDIFTNVIFWKNVSIKVCIAQFQKKSCAVLYFLRFIHKEIISGATSENSPQRRRDAEIF